MALSSIRSPRLTTKRAGPSAAPRLVVARASNPFAFLNFGNKTEQRVAAKEELLARLDGLDRGAAATAEDKADVERLASALEKLNPTPQPLKAPQLLSGSWRLLYTTSDSILATNRPALLRPRGSIYQIIDVERLKARNNETWPFFNAVTADLTPVSANKVAVQFRTFKLFGGLISITAPDSARGELAFTYLDETLRVSRGDKGNLFLLDMDEGRRGARLEGQ
ncbi:putative plastid-lipid-associated protein 4, chloroplastic [Tetrabaena socialis]|uniref:Putative plastid-lipid-associated protein 4, chloroplastic n=1 Tax=Tetrabaena socialis TaxID=47790 RepID=A0A2J7ZND7_9CHLO|nr:putative plastid-lipid-associated protein 4, chloroplastic [Tetrabaena socialis]|eukprot:PNH01789.1 putative plastid-lipid-associated protein 4, chloroplastic [Tetrabaena socialis]